MATIVDININSTIPIRTEDGEFSNIQKFFKFPTVDFFEWSLCKCQPPVIEQELVQNKKHCLHSEIGIEVIIIKFSLKVKNINIE